MATTKRPRRQTTKGATQAPEAAESTGPQGKSRSRKRVKVELAPTSRDDTLPTAQHTAPLATGWLLATAEPVLVDGLTEYELQREEQIRRNRERMLALQLPDAAAAIKAPSKEAKPTQRGVSSKRVKASREPSERRASLRVRGLMADAGLAAGVADESERGAVVLASSTAEAARKAESAAAATAAAERLTKAVAACSSNGVAGRDGRPGDDEVFLQLLAGLGSSGGSSSADALVGKNSGDTATVAGGAGACWSYGDAEPGGGGVMGVLERLTLREEDVAKVTKDGATHLAFHPSSEKLLLAAGDKSGHVGLWMLDDLIGQQGTTSDKDGASGILLFAPHSQYVSGLCWAGGSSGCSSGSNSCSNGSGFRLFTSSYEGAVRWLDPEAAMFESVKGLQKGTEVAALEVERSEGNLVYVGDNEGELQMLDVRAGAAARAPLTLHSRKINSLHIEPTHGRLLASSSSDGSVCVWDVRQLGGSSSSGSSSGGSKVKALATLRHDKSCHSAFWASDGSQRILSTSYDDTVRVWGPDTSTSSSTSTSNIPSSFEQQLRIKHNNQTGRWIVPFKAVWVTGPPPSTTATAAAATAADDVTDGDSESPDDSETVPLASRRRKIVNATVSATATAATAKKGSSSAAGAAGGLDQGAILVGSLSGRAVDRFSATDGSSAGCYRSELMTAISARFAVHPSLPVFAAATGSGRVHVFR